MIQAVTLRFIKCRTIAFGRPWVWLRTLINLTTHWSAPVFTSFYTLTHYYMYVCVYVCAHARVNARCHFGSRCFLEPMRFVLFRPPSLDVV